MPASSRRGGTRPSLPGHSHDLAPAFDLERARALLAEAGYPGGRGLPELTLVHATLGEGDDAFRREREAGWRQWHELGVRPRHEWHTWTDRHDLESSFADADLLEWSWADSPDPDGMFTLLDAVPVVRETETERLIARARVLRSRDERLELYREADRQLVAERVWVVPATYWRPHVAHRAWLDGVRTSPFAVSPLNDIVVQPH